MGVPIGGGMMETTAFFDEVEGVVNELQDFLGASGPPGGLLSEEKLAAVLQARELLMVAATLLFETQMMHLGMLRRHGKVTGDPTDPADLNVKSFDRVSDIEGLDSADTSNSIDIKEN